jgi:hypothetical protein
VGFAANFNKIDRCKLLNVNNYEQIVTVLSLLSLLHLS